MVLQIKSTRLTIKRYGRQPMTILSSMVGGVLGGHTHAIQHCAVAEARAVAEPRGNRYLESHFIAFFLINLTL